MVEDIPALIAALDSTRDADTETARHRLVPLGPDILPHALDGFRALRTWRGRHALVYSVVKFSRRHDTAVELGIEALADRSGRVRSRACAVLAFSLREHALPALERAADDPDPVTARDVAAAIDAIRCRNHNLYLDRNHSGRVFWNVMGSEPFL